MLGEHIFGSLLFALFLSLSLSVFLFLSFFRSLYVMCMKVNDQSVLGRVKAWR